MGEKNAGGEQPAQGVLRKVLSLEDLESLARRRLPGPLFGYVQGGSETNSSLESNRTSFQHYGFVTRILRDIMSRSLETRLMGRTYGAPFGIAPMGICALTAFDGDLVLARAARQANIPMVISAASLISLEEIAEANPDVWFQAYLIGEPEKFIPMVERVQRAGIGTLVITVDIPVRSNRENNVRVGFKTPLRPSPQLAWVGLTRPAWLLDVFVRTVLKRGIPHFENGGAERGAPVISSRAEREFMGRGRLNWDHIATIRKMWKGRLVLKGVMSPDDVENARRHGVDAIVVSNHGGRQLDGALAPLHLIRELVRAAGSMPVMVDSGFRRGTDVVKALALGAAFVFVGRPFNYAAAIAGEAGVTHVIKLLAQEIDRDIGMLGYTAIDQIDAGCLRLADGSALPDLPAKSRRDAVAGGSPARSRGAEYAKT